MRAYEFRILGELTKGSIVYSAAYYNDHAAIRAAKRLAGDRKFEVWRDLDCIYGTGHDVPTPRLQPSTSLIPAA